MSPPDPYRERVAERLRGVLRSRGISVRAVEKLLGHGRGYVADALQGQKKLGVEVILEVLAAVRVPPEEFFERPMPSSSRETSGSSTPPRRDLATSATAPPRDVRAIVDALLLLLAERGLLSSDQLAELQRELASRESA